MEGDGASRPIDILVKINLCCPEASTLMDRHLERDPHPVRLNLKSTADLKDVLSCELGLLGRLLFLRLKSRATLRTQYPRATASDRIIPSILISCLAVLKEQGRTKRLA